MRVSKWGNSLAVRLPQTLVEKLGLKEGDDLELRAVDGRRLEVVREPTRAELIEQLHQFHGLFPDDFKFDREEANAR